MKRACIKLNTNTDEQIASSIRPIKINLVRMKKIAITLVICLALFSCKHSETGNQSLSQQKTVCVKVINVSQQGVGITLNYSGIIEPEKNVPLSFQLPGIVEKVYVNEGDFVNKGQILAQLDKTSTQSSYNAAAAIQQQAQDAYNRLKTVYDNGSLPEIKWEEVQSKLEQANSAAKIARQNLDHCTITAPISGIIGNRNIEEGATATPGIKVFNVFSIQSVYARISVPEDEINHIKKGQNAQITIPALNNQEASGRIERVSLIANPVSKTYEVKMLVNNQNEEIKPGMVCNVNMDIADENPAILLPFQSVLKDENEKTYVYVIDNTSNTAKRRYIQISGLINNKIGVTSGLVANDMIVSEGQQKLADNTSVQILN